MKKLLFACALLLLPFAPAMAHATDVTGTWSGHVSGGGGDFQLSFSFKQDGTKLTGNVQGPGEPIAITDGKIEGDKISFKISFNGMTITHEGTVSGDEIKLTSKSDSGDMGGEMTLKRTPAAGSTAPPAAPPQ